MKFISVLLSNRCAIYLQKSAKIAATLLIGLFFLISIEAEAKNVCSILMKLNVSMDRYLELKQKLAIQAIKSNINRLVINYKEKLNPITSRFGDCGPVSYRLFYFIKSRDLSTPIRPVTASIKEWGQVHYLKNGEQKTFTVGHSYLVDQSLGEEHEIIIDPTYLQFFGGASAPKELTEIFVGTRVDLILLATTYSTYLSVAGRYPFPPGHRIDPVEFVDQIYGIGTNPDRRIEYQEEP